MLETIPCHSLAKIFPDSDPAKAALRYTTFLRNEVFSLQLAFRSDAMREDFSLRADAPCPIRIYLAENVPVLRPALRTFDEFYERTAPGLYPDVLRPVAEGERLRACTGWQSLWIELRPETPLDAGPLTLTLRLAAPGGEELNTVTIRLRAADALLPEQSLTVTNWFHCDCLARRYHLTLFEEDFWPVFRRFAAAAAENGQNMLLLPAFTPPLDTPVGGERMTAQLVGVSLDPSGWRFDFSLMERYIREALACGIRLFEHSHLFTQWGAAHAPKIVVRVNGKTESYFGWQTDAGAEEYRAFLRAYLTALRSFLNARGWEKRLFFHVSDEPTEEVLDAYARAKELVRELLADFPSGDALSSPVFCEKGLVDVPIVCVDHADEFTKAAPVVWGYFTGYQAENGYPNRLIATTAARNRILGVMLWYAGLKGFLHWGFNFWFTELSREEFDPFLRPDADGDFAAGTSYLVYPGPDGPWPSMRLPVFAEGVRDYEALTLLEKKLGREAVMRLVEEHFGAPFTFRSCCGAETLLSFREKVNRLCEEA